ncbi:MAG: ubiquinone/menaquinone biosynthesis methyltransferase [Planctomycetota bacterium]|jgi:demethylmenaquinone methyltransferase/2-methoxy-6-polyprenyl-1,4-benzoquinol methylase
MPDNKSLSVKKMFAEVPATYELVNHVLTLGLDVLWRRRAAKIAATGNAGKWADMCTGTGDMAVCLSRLAPEGTSICGVDFSEPMLAEARKKPEAENIEFIAADIKALPFDDATFDVLTMSFATRNVNLSKDALVRSFAEYYRVLKPGGHFVNVETSQPSLWLIRKCFHTYIKLLVRAIGSRISGTRNAYTYLATTIPRFYPAEELAEIMREAGFEKVTFQKLLFGVVAIHRASKL